MLLEKKVTKTNFGSRNSWRTWISLRFLGQGSENEQWMGMATKICKTAKTKVSEQNGGELAQKAVLSGKIEEKQAQSLVFKPWA